ncbi:MAG: hypothetical protein B6241_06035 [Spirochaetaceae bacterium 4572_59]|nr:MAG: hypothetical protein B6241_06035 [Spirochaetaceae bacterium 4572_59]
MDMTLICSQSCITYQQRTDGRIMKEKTKDLIENFILFVILLVLIQTFLEDMAVILSWSWGIRKILVFTGFGFDLFFTVEFLTRYFSAIKRGEGIKYVLKERGWIDLIASMPLLLLSSGPAVVSILEGSAFIGAAGMLNILKVVKTVRIARILRLLRLLKIFKKIKFVHSAMAQRHLTRIITTVISSLVLSLTVVSFLLTLFHSSDADLDFVKKHESLISTAVDLQDKDLLTFYGDSLFESQDSVLIVRTGEGTVYSRYNNRHYSQWYGPSDYGYVRQGNMELFYNLKPIYVGEAIHNLLIFLSILLMLGVLMLFYSPHFAMTVTDPVNIMIKGFSDSSYNLEVLIPKDLSEDDIFQLARLYNEEYLPLKARNSTSENASNLSLKLEDFDDLLKG